MASAAYRSDIDGLRCLAILPVVFNHAGFSAVPGGFIGVDIFFVISGFLITGILARELDESRFSIVRFYERRARRILPALFAVIIACLIAGWFIMLPSEYVRLAKSAIATLLFVSNFWFWHAAGDYFGANVVFEPLLHTWSLAVEEQFYIVFPLLLWGLSRLPRRIWIAAIATICLVSFALSLWLTSAYPTFSFYLLPSRAWELGLGALLALGLIPPPATRQAWLPQIAGFGGLVLIVGSILLVDDSTPFPGLSALPACVGTAALIWAGTGRDHLVGRLLSLAPVVWVGLISYSLYLWHWPVLIAARMIESSAVLDLPLAWACIGLSLALAFLSWKFVEQPFRRKARMAAPTRKQIFGFSAGGIFLLGSVSAGVVLAAGLPLRLGASANGLHAQATRLHLLDRQCTTQGESPIACPIGATASGAQVAYVLWGDSHAGAMISGFDHWLNEQGKAGIAFAKAACAPMLGLRRADMGSRHGCDTHNAAVLARILADYPQATIVLVGRWTMLAMGTRMVGEPGGLAILAPSGEPAAGIAANAALLENGLAELVAKLRQADRRVVLLAGVPEPGFHVPNNQARAAMLGTAPREVSRATFDQRIATSDPLLARVAERYGARLVRPADFLCDDTSCAVLLEGRPLYRDDDHLSIAGAAWLVPRMMDAAAP